MTSICIVDDNRAVALQLVRAVQAAGYEDAMAFQAPEEALAHCLTHPIDVALVDFAMPGMDGVSFVRALQAHDETRGIAAALVTGCPPADFKAAAFDAGALDVLVKPVLPAELEFKLAQLQRAARQRQGASRFDVERNHAFVHCLELIATLHDPVPGKHTERLAAYAVAIGRHAGQDEAWLADLDEAARLHDIGRVVDEDDADCGHAALDRDHTLAGYELLRELPGRNFALAAEIALTHHEYWDGSGGPRGLSGEEIPLAGRIVAIADAFDLITSIPGHDPAWLLARAQAVVESDAGVQFDPALVQAFGRAREDLVAIKRHFDGDTAAAPRVVRPHWPQLS